MKYFLVLSFLFSFPFIYANDGNSLDPNSLSGVYKGKIMNDSGEASIGECQLDLKIKRERNGFKIYSAEIDYRMHGMGSHSFITTVSDEKQDNQFSLIGKTGLPFLKQVVWITLTSIPPTISIWVEYPGLIGKSAKHQPDCVGLKRNP